MTGPKISFWIISSSWLEAVDDRRLVEVAAVALAVAARHDLGVVGRALDEAR